MSKRNSGFFLPVKNKKRKSSGVINNKGHIKPPDNKHKINLKPNQKFDKKRNKYRPNFTAKLQNNTEEIASDSDSVVEEEREHSPTQDLVEIDNETPQDKRVRLAREYINELKKFEKEREKPLEEPEVDDPIGELLKQDSLEMKYNLHRDLSSIINLQESSEFITLRGHTGVVSALVFSHDEKFFYSACKNAILIQWHTVSRIKIKVLNDPRKKNLPKIHTKHILALAVSTNGRYLASGGLDKKVEIWDLTKLEHCYTFTGHKGAITGVTFRKDSLDLYSCSEDRTVKIWNVEDRLYVESLFGHVAPITGIDSWFSERALTCGGIDKSIRIWKIVEETQLLFQSDAQTIDCAKFINNTGFVSGSQEGDLSLWTVSKKKPILVIPKAHKGWISCILPVPNSDIIVSGSNDGEVKIWRQPFKHKELELIGSIPVKGCVNSVLVTYNADTLIMGVGREHRLGRWFSDNSAKNCIIIAKLT